jgi:hypothetical protein
LCKIMHEGVADWIIGHAYPPLWFTSTKYRSWNEAIIESGEWKLFTMGVTVSWVVETKSERMKVSTPIPTHTNLF